MAVAFTFPGQGSQAVGMGRDLSESFACSREVFQEVDDALSQNLSQIMWEGPEDDLRLTENAQPALMAVSLATVRAMKVEFGIEITRADLLAGHSLGEYSALCAAGGLSLAETARLLKIRGRAMQDAVPVDEGAMAALLGIDVDAVEEIARKASAAEGGAVCAPANDNAPGQVVVSGVRAAVEKAMELAKEAGARRSVLLQVSAPFHCSLMQPAVDAMQEALQGTDIRMPAVPVISNVTAEPVQDPSRIADLLVQQITAMVRWRETVQNMASAGVDTVVELGTGKVLTGLLRRIDRELSGMAAGTPSDLESLASTLG